MLVDEDENIRKQATEIIMKAKENEQFGRRKFKKPNINFNAKSYYEMVDINDEVNLYVPPLLEGVSNDQLRGCIESAENIVKSMTQGIPCHTQAVERVIKSVSEASHIVFGAENRHARVVANIESRSILPQTKTKANYSNYVE